MAFVCSSWKYGWIRPGSRIKCSKHNAMRVLPNIDEWDAIYDLNDLKKWLIDLMWKRLNPKVNFEKKKLDDDEKSKAMKEEG